MTPLFIATEKFDSSDDDRWNEYVQWARIPKLVEVVSLDSILCPAVCPDIKGEDWKHNVHEDYRLNYFYHLDYLMNRCAGVSRRNILGLYRNSDGHLDAPPGSGAFAFVGYDLIEEASQISALTNCGGFPNTFSNDELNEYGLIADFKRASEIRRRLPERNPTEPHANCRSYAIWRLDES